MKKGLLIAASALLLAVSLWSCNKNNSSLSAPYMIATIPSGTGTDYTFNAVTVTPSTIDTQVHDTATDFVITGLSSDPTYPWDKIVIAVTDYKGLTGTFSIAEGQAYAYYYHAGVYNDATGGVVAISSITANMVVGYFSFTAPNATISNGDFTVYKP